MSMKYEEACWTWSVGFFKSNEMSNGHLSSMFILVHPITHKKILQFSELQDFHCLSSDFGGDGEIRTLVQTWN